MQGCALVMENWIRPPQVGYGVPGGVALDADGSIETAHANGNGRFVVASTLRACVPVYPAIPSSGHASIQQDAINAFLAGCGLGGIDYRLMKMCAYESSVLTSPALVDPRQGQRVFVLGPHEALFGDDCYVRRVRDAAPVASVDLRSPVLQVDECLCRTARGIAFFASDADLAPKEQPQQPFYVLEEEFAHFAPLCSSSQNIVDGLLTTGTDGVLKVWDVEHQASTLEWQLPRGKLASWTRAEPFGPDTVLWSSIYEVALLDSRADPQRPATKSLIRFEDRQEEVRAMCMDDAGNVFVLSTYHLYWIGATPAGGLNGTEMLLTLEHPISAADTSISLAHTSFIPAGANNNNNNNNNYTNKIQLVTAASQITPSVQVWMFGTTLGGRPCLLADPHVVDLWPTILPQSHATVQADGDSVHAFYATNTNGLFRQRCVFDRNGRSSSSTDPMPLAETSCHATRLHAHAAAAAFNTAAADFHYQEVRLPSEFYNFADYYRLAFGEQGVDGTSASALPAETDSTPTHPGLNNGWATSSEGQFEFLGFDSKAGFQQYCTEMWRNPLISRGVDASALERRSKLINKVVSDMSAFTSGCGVEAPEPLVELALNRKIQTVVGKWKISDGAQTQDGMMGSELGSELDSQTQADQFSSQMSQSQSQTQSQATQSSARAFPTLSLSQPVLRRPKKKKSKKRRIK